MQTYERSHNILNPRVFAVNDGGAGDFVWFKRLKQNGSLIASASHECPPKPSSPDAVCSFALFK